VSVLTLDQAKVEGVVARASARGLVRVANLLCPGNLVLSGEVAACEEAARLAEEAGGRTHRLSVAGAFHTPLMESAVAPLKEALAAAALAQPRVPVWANVTARPYRDAGEVRDLLARQVTEPVLWEQTGRGLLEAGVERFYEIGPGR